MNILITGAAGNLGSHLARHFIAMNRRSESPHHLKLLIHKHEPPADIAEVPNVTIYRADLAAPESLKEPCKGTDCVIHFAGILFAPRPEKFLPVTNTAYVENIVNAAIDAGVKKFIIVSFPHVEGESSPAHPAKGSSNGKPVSVHAQTRLAAEKYLFKSCEGKTMTPVALRPGMIYGHDILMIDAARWLSRRRLLFVWKKPTWIHLLSLPDFLAATQAAIEKEDIRGVYNLGDDGPLTLQEFLYRAAKKWGVQSVFVYTPPIDIFRELLWWRHSDRKWWEGYPPWVAPHFAFFVAATLVEAFTAVAHTRAPITRDFIRIGMASYAMDTSRMKEQLLPRLRYPTLTDGMEIL